MLSTKKEHIQKVTSISACLTTKPMLWYFAQMYQQRNIYTWTSLLRVIYITHFRMQNNAFIINAILKNVSNYSFNPNTLNLFPTLMKLSFPAFCLVSLLLFVDDSNNSRINLSLDSHIKDSRDMCKASLFFSTNWVWKIKQTSVFHPSHDDMPNAPESTKTSCSDRNVLYLCHPKQMPPIRGSTGSMASGSRKCIFNLV